MSEQRLNDLEGRIEALANLLLYVTDELANNNIIDGSQTECWLRRKADKIQGLDLVIQAPAEKSLSHFADELAYVRTHRQKLTDDL